MNKEIFLSICDRLTSQVPALRWVDWDSGQLDIQSERPPVAFPACLVEIEYPQCEEIGAEMQLVTCNVTLRLAFWPQGETSSVSPVREAALAAFDTIGQVHAALQGWSTEALSIFSRLSAKAERRKDGLKVYRVVYQTTFTETVD